VNETEKRYAAEIMQWRAQTLRTLLDAGFTWQSALTAVAKDDVTLLKHTGRYSMQLRPDMGVTVRERYDLINGWLAQKVDGCTCAPGPMGEHEPNCGWEPLANIEDIVARFSRTTP